MNASSWLQFGMWGMILGTIIIGLISATMRKEDRDHAYLAGWITLIAATSYYALNIGFGNFVINGQEVQLARYVDWLITTPLLLASLVLVAIPKNKSKERTAILAGIIGLDVYMILTGLFATLTDNKWPWYIFSCVALALIIYMLYVVVLNESKKVAGIKVTKLYTSLALLLSVLWFAYPVVWYLSGSGVGTLTFETENAIYSILDLTAKAVFGIILIINIKKLTAEVKPKVGESTIEAATK